MRISRLSAVVLTATTLLSAAFAQTIYETGFEGPTFSMGALDGQDAWMVTPESAIGTVQNSVVNGGTQALELVDGASFGRAQRNISTAMTQPILTASFSMYFGSGWITDMESDRFEAQARLEVAGLSPGVFGIEFGFLQAPAGGYESVPGDGSAFYIEVGSESAMMASSYELVNFGDYANAWHTYSLVFDESTDSVAMWVDGVLRTQLTLTDDIDDISNVQLQNQRWGTSPQNNASLYFDDLTIGQAVPEPASMLILAIGAGVLARRQRLSKRN